MQWLASFLRCSTTTPSYLLVSQRPFPYFFPHILIPCGPHGIPSLFYDRRNFYRAPNSLDLCEISACTFQSSWDTKLCFLQFVSASLSLLPTTRRLRHMQWKSYKKTFFPRGRHFDNLQSSWIDLFLFFFLIFGLILDICSHLLLARKFVVANTHVAWSSRSYLFQENFSGTITLERIFNAIFFVKNCRYKFVALVDVCVSSVALQTFTYTSNVCEYISMIRPNAWIR